jgi:CRP/FNR family transcriptional regulator, cyclic AMP receptor protein
MLCGRAARSLGPPNFPVGADPASDHRGACALGAGGVASPPVAVEVDALSEVPLLAGLERAELERLAGQFTEHGFAKGTAIMREGARGARVLAFFVIAEGSVSVAVGGETKALLGPGDHFGEIGLFYDEPRTATVTAEADLRCYALSAWDFRPFVEENPQIAWPIMETMAQRLAGNAGTAGD